MNWEFSSVVVITSGAAGASANDDIRLVLRK